MPIPHNEFNGFGGLKTPHGAHQWREHTIGAAGMCNRLGLGIKYAGIAGLFSLSGIDAHQLARPFNGGCTDERLSMGNAAGINELSNRPLIGTIQHHIGKRNCGIEKRCIDKSGFGNYFSFGTGAPKCGGPRSDLELANIGGPKQGLPRKVGGIHLVAIKPVQSADSACREI